MAATMKRAYTGVECPLAGSAHSQGVHHRDTRMSDQNNIGYDAEMPYWLERTLCDGECKDCPQLDCEERENGYEDEQATQ